VNYLLAKEETHAKAQRRKGRKQDFERKREGASVYARTFPLCMVFKS
jgi:hypothetical protein